MTYPSAPPAVADFFVQSVTSRSVTLEWVPPDTDCPIVDYFITINGTILWTSTDDDTYSNTTIDEANNVTNNIIYIIAIRPSEYYIKFVRERIITYYI